MKSSHHNYKKLAKEEKMKVLFYGVGVMGSLYAAQLKESGQDVSVLARVQRLADIREHGIVLEDVSTGNRTTTRVNVVERIDSEDAYDLVVVMMPKNHVPEILPILAANRYTPNILFMFNNAAGPDEMINALGRERVLIGFPGAGGTRKGHVVRYMVVSGRQQPTTFGELDGSTTPRLEQVAGVFKGAGFPVAISSQMDAWLKTHVAEVSPMANALYMAGGDNYRLARTRDAIVRDEMKQIADEFKVLARSTSVPTPAMDRLYTYTDPAVPSVAEGSAQIAMNWRGVWIGLGVLAGLILISTLLL
jgi:2-dehydropantoate 2-reductase